ncbi:MAG: hypothetical protein RLZZ08_813 [Pseudomonadota bacterium]|jgi:surface antigen
MRPIFATFLTLGVLGIAVPALADDAIGVDLPSTVGGELPPYLECVPYARAQSGIQIYGDAWTWWDKADGLYQRGNRPQKGAVLAFQPFGNMRLGHVAAVSKIVDRRTVLLSHANWSPIDGHRGQIERDVRAVDVSPANDWSQVRVWYAPLGDLGTTAWPTSGFIYPKAVRGGSALPRPQIAAAVVPAMAPALAPQVQTMPKQQPARMMLAAAEVPASPAKAPIKPAILGTAPRPTGFASAFSGLPAGKSTPAPALAGAQRSPARSVPQQAAAAPEDIIGDIIRRHR